MRVCLEIWIGLAGLATTSRGQVGEEEEEEEEEEEGEGEGRGREGKGREGKGKGKLEGKGNVMQGDASQVPRFQ